MWVTQEQSIQKYGTPAYTGWGQAEAEADFKSKGGNTSQSTTNSLNTVGGNTANGIYSTNQAATDIKSQYSNLLGILKGQTDTATASEYGKRGIPVSSGVVSNAQTQNYTNAAGALLNNEANNLAGLASNPSTSSSSASGGAGANPDWAALQAAYSNQQTNTPNTTQQTTPTVQRLADGSPATLGFASQFTAGNSGVSAQEAAKRAASTGIEAAQAQQTANGYANRANVLSSILNLGPQSRPTTQPSNAMSFAQSFTTNPLATILNYRAY